MTREEIKKVLPVIQAFTEGKVIQTKNGDETWITIGKETDLNIESLAEYPDCFRIKPEPEYRPFKDADECWQEMLKHEPFGWLREKKRNVYTQIGFMHTEGIQGTSGGSSNYKAFFDCFSFADGAPFGVKEGIWEK